MSASAVQFMVSEYALQIGLYHDQIVCRLRFINERGECEETALYSIREINNIIALWQMGALAGSFGIGTFLMPNASVLIEELPRIA